MVAGSTNALGSCARVRGTCESGGVAYTVSKAWVCRQSLRRRRRPLLVAALTGEAGVRLCGERGGRAAACVHMRARRLL
jgi:hypothetical protein